MLRGRVGWGGLDGEGGGVGWLGFATRWGGGEGGQEEGAERGRNDREERGSREMQRGNEEVVQDGRWLLVGSGRLRIRLV